MNSINLSSSCSSVDDLIRLCTYDKRQEDAFYVVDLEDILLKHRNWVLAMPRVNPFYAIKCNSSRVVLEILAGLGLGFDCASKAEIDTVLGQKCSPKKIVFANPCKPLSHIRHAMNLGVDMMTFDNREELLKIAQIAPDARLILRIRADDTGAQCVLSDKFGAAMDDVDGLLKLAHSLDLSVIGVSFHVGSGCHNPVSFSEAIRNARQVFDKGRSVYGFDMSLLDIGGGFPGSPDSAILFNQIASVVNQSLDEHFPASENVNIIAEPGRYYVASAFTLACHIIAKRTTVQENGETVAMYYLNDGVYGSFNCTLFDHQDVRPLPLEDPDSLADHHDRRQLSTVIWGPTCDAMDCIKRDIKFPEMKVGEWIVFRSMGAYTVSAASGFNGFPIPSLKYFINSYSFDMISKFYNWSKIAKTLKVRQNESAIPKKFLNRPSASRLDLIEVS
ncbi:ornithine decarboxylase-like [Brevipalpus obovatus]|uniref:ornithine decarboxylase-like n=1 Tax=Brevipalpus obovatus TaxID=246614 RepID=UPI003D9DCC6A